jgi:hypothetical protein
MVLGTLLLAGMLQVEVLMRSGHFFNLPNPSSCTMVLGFTQPLTEMSTRSLSGGKVQLAHKADNLSSVSRLSRKCQILNILQPNTPPQSVAALALIFIF